MIENLETIPKHRDLSRSGPSTTPSFGHPSRSFLRRQEPGREFLFPAFLLIIEGFQKNLPPKAVGRSIHGRQQMQQRRLARAAAPDDGGKPMRRDLQVYAVERFHAGRSHRVDFRDAAQADERPIGSLYGLRSGCLIQRAQSWMLSRHAKVIWSFRCCHAVPPGVGHRSLVIGHQGATPMTDDQ